jgi:hypothetical protein
MDRFPTSEYLSNAPKAQSTHAGSDRKRVYSAIPAASSYPRPIGARQGADASGHGKERSQTARVFPSSVRRSSLRHSSRVAVGVRGGRLSDIITLVPRRPAYRVDVRTNAGSRILDSAHIDKLWTD